MRNLLLLTLVCSFLFVFGCADVQTPTAKNIITEPLGATQVTIGMSTARVVSLLGEPDMKQMVASKEWEAGREEWFYRGRYSGLPLGTDYLAKDLYLYFDGDNLTKISREPLGQALSVAEEIK